MRDLGPWIVAGLSCLLAVQTFFALTGHEESEKRHAQEKARLKRTIKRLRSNAWRLRSIAMAEAFEHGRTRMKLARRVDLHDVDGRALLKTKMELATLKRRLFNDD